MSYFELMGFQPGGWGMDMLKAAGTTVLVAAAGFASGIVLGILGAAARLSRLRALGLAAEFYTTAFRGVPNLLVIYLFYFGSSSVLSAVAGAFGGQGFVGAPAFLTGALAIGVVSGAYQTEVFRGAYLALPRGEIEAARAVGMTPVLAFRRIILPQAARFAIPGLANVWQSVLKQSALVSVTGLVELMRQSQVGAGSTRQPFSFFLTAGVLYLLVTVATDDAFRRAERRAMRGIRRAL
jgi:octopine/nopaline transport system permease protein